MFRSADRTVLTCLATRARWYLHCDRITLYRSLRPWQLGSILISSTTNHLHVRLGTTRAISAFKERCLSGRETYSHAFRVSSVSRAPCTLPTMPAPFSIPTDSLFNSLWIRRFVEAFFSFLRSLTTVVPPQPPRPRLPRLLSPHLTQQREPTNTPQFIHSRPID